MNRQDAYKEAARRIAGAASRPGAASSRVTVENHADVAVVQASGREDLGVGAYVQAQIWVDAAEAAAVLEINDED